MKKYIFVFSTVIAFTFGTFTNAYSAEKISGSAWVLDGDTIDLYITKEQKERIRFQGIDAPEKSQNCLDNSGNSYPCGENAKWKLINMIDKQKVTCDYSSKGKYGRIIGTCYANGVNLNKFMVSHGYAMSYYEDTYKSEEQNAKSQKLGFWDGVFEDPSKHR